MEKAKHNLCLWANLPNDLLPNIAGRFNSVLDYLPLRAVCNSWRSSIRLPSFVEEIPSLTFNLPDLLDQDYLLSKTSICRVELTTNHTRNPSKGWLILIRHTKTGKMQLLHPVSGLQIRYSSIPAMSSSNTRVRFVPLYESFKLECVNPDPILEVRKMIFPSSTTFAANSVAFLVIFIPGVLSFWASRDGNWMGFNGDGDHSHYDDIIEFKGQVYVVDELGAVFWINPLSLSLIQYSPVLLIDGGGGSRKNLVESCGDLYIVDRYVDSRRKEIDFRVYKLDEDLGVWLNVICLADQIFVLNTDFSFSVSATEFVGGRGNCIYFTNDNDGDGKVRVFRMDNGTVKKLESVPEYSEIFLSPNIRLN